MKKIIVLIILPALMLSCASSSNFTKQKFTDLKKVKTSHQEEPEIIEEVPFQDVVETFCEEIEITEETYIDDSQQMNFYNKVQNEFAINEGNQELDDSKLAPHIFDEHKSSFVESPDRKTTANFSLSKDPDVVHLKNESQQIDFETETPPQDRKYRTEEASKQFRIGRNLMLISIIVAAIGLILYFAAYLITLLYVIPLILAVGLMAAALIFILRGANKVRKERILNDPEFNNKKKFWATLRLVILLIGIPIGLFLGVFGILFGI